MSTQPPGLRAASPRAWFAVAGATFGGFMALLDVSVTNASLPQIQGEIGASGTEGTWIGTGYLVAEIIVIPLTGWLTRLLGLRNFLMAAGILFTGFSILCGFAGSLPQMIAGRVGQGLAGGALIPLGLTIISTRLPPAQRPLGLAVYGSASLLAPVVGPLLGGWLTEEAGWRWLFFINAPITVMFLALLMVGIERAQPNVRELGRADWFGIAGLASLLGCLTVVLEEGQRENWFDSPMVVGLSVATVGGMILVLITQFTHPHPVVKLKLLIDPSYLAVIVAMIFASASLFTTLYIIPVFLGTISGYDAEHTGVVAMVPGLSTLLMMPVLFVLMRHIDHRLIVGAGLLITGVGCLLQLNLTSASVGNDFIVSQLIVGAGQIMVAFPLSLAATAHLPPESVADGSALFSMARNLGGSLGLALTGILLERRMSFHVAELGQVTTANSLVGQEHMRRLAGAALDGGVDFPFASLRGLGLVAAQIKRQALVMSYVDAFWVLGLCLILAAPLVLLMKRSSGSGAAMSH